MLFKDLVFGMHKIMASGTFEWLKRHRIVSYSSKSTIFWYYMKHSFIYLLVPVLSLGSVTLCIMCIGTIAGQKLTGYIALHSITVIIFHYFPLLWQLHGSCFCYPVMQK